MGFVPHDRPSARLALYVRDRYAGVGATKRLAADIGVTRKQAENLLAGHWPSDLTFAAIIRRWGRDCLECLFARDIDPVLATLTEREAAIDRELEAVRARIREAQGAAISVPDSAQDGQARLPFAEP